MSHRRIFSDFLILLLVCASCAGGFFMLVAYTPKTLTYTGPSFESTFEPYRSYISGAIVMPTEGIGEALAKSATNSKTPGSTQGASTAKEPSGKPSVAQTVPAPAAQSTPAPALPSFQAPTIPVTTIQTNTTPAVIPATIPAVSSTPNSTPTQTTTNTTPTPPPAVFPSPAIPTATPTPVAQTPVPTQTATGGSSPGFGISVSSTLYTLSDAELAARLDAFKTLGITWVRMDISWSEVQKSGTSAPKWTAADRVVSAIVARNMHVLGLLTDTPSWARVGGCTSPRCEPEQPADFAYYAGQAAKHFKPMGVHAWEIWNEPNITLFWLPSPNPDKYTDILRLSYKAIKEQDSSAEVITGSFSPAATSNGNYAPIDFLSRMYDFGAQPYFDAVGFHPYSFPETASLFHKYNAWSQMQDTNPSLRSVMADHGDSSKKIWLTEYGAPTGGPGIAATLDNYKTIKNSDHVDEELQAFMVTDAVNAMKQYTWTGPLFWYNYKDLGTDRGTIENFFGLVRYDGSQKPAYQALKQAISTF